MMSLLRNNLNKYINPETKKDIDQALILLGPEFLKTKAMKSQWSRQKPTTNYCYLVSETLYWYYFWRSKKPFYPQAHSPHFHRLNATHIKPHVSRIPKLNTTHWFLKGYLRGTPSTCIIDYTYDQFDEKLTDNELLDVYNTSKCTSFLPVKYDGILGPSRKTIDFAEIYLGVEQGQWRVFA